MFVFECLRMLNVVMRFKLFVYNVCKVWGTGVQLEVYGPNKEDLVPVILGEDD